MAAAQTSIAQSPPVLAPLLERKAAIAADLARTVRDCVVRKDTTHAAFHGCIDWHSAVHGTWALTAYTRMTGDRQYEPLIAATLEPGKIAVERDLLRAQPRFEMPYGRAWFLRLAVEHKLAFGTDALRPMAGDVLASMLAVYRQRAPDPRRGSYDSDTWALINMHDYAVATQNAVVLETIRSLVRRHIVTDQGGCAYAGETGHFMAVCTNWAWLIAKVLNKSEFARWEENFSALRTLPSPVTKPVNWHHYGLNFSRAWGLWGLYEASSSSNAKQAYLEAYAAHFRASFEDPQNWRGSYEGVAHWVPQFGLFALQPLFTGAKQP